MPVACWPGGGDGQGLEGSLAGGTVWPEKLPSAGERCVFSHTRPPLATAVYEAPLKGRRGGRQPWGQTLTLAKHCVFILKYKKYFVCTRMPTHSKNNTWTCGWWFFKSPCKSKHVSYRFSWLVHKENPTLVTLKKKYIEFKNALWSNYIYIYIYHIHMYSYLSTITLYLIT